MERPVELLKRCSLLFTGWQQDWEKTLPLQGYSIREIRALLEIRRSAPCPFRDLARRLGVGPGQLTRLVSRLRDDGLLHLNDGEDPRRLTHFRLAEKGMALATRLQQGLDQAIAAHLGQLSPDQQILFTRSIQQIIDLYEP